VPNKRGKFGVNIFTSITRYTDMVIFVLGHFYSD